jgi:hypothetical protein
LENTEENKKTYYFYLWEAWLEFLGHYWQYYSLQFRLEESHWASFKAVLFEWLWALFIS